MAITRSDHPTLSHVTFNSHIHWLGVSEGIDTYPRMAAIAARLAKREGTVVEGGIMDKGTSYIEVRNHKAHRVVTVTLFCGIDYRHANVTVYTHEIGE